MSALSEQARAFLETRRVAHLATADGHGQPHVVPVCFVVLEERVYVAIDEKPKRGDPLELRRIRNIVDNPRTALVADVFDEDWSRLGFVLVRGRARLVADQDEHQRAVRALRKKYVQYRAMALEGRPMLALDIARVTTWGRLETD